jgi:hypothetical protein
MVLGLVPAPYPGKVVKSMNNSKKHIVKINGSDYAVSGSGLGWDGTIPNTNRSTFKTQIKPNNTAVNIYGGTVTNKPKAKQKQIKGYW